MRRLGAAVAVLTALAGGCASDDDGVLQGDVTASTSTTPSSPSTTSTTVDQPGTQPPPACEQILVGAGNPEQIDLQADVDGDEADDTVSSFALDGDEDGRRYRLQVALAAGGGAHVDIPADGETSVALLGGAVLERFDHREVLWVRVGAGASTTILGLFHLDGCALEAATFANGDPVEVPIGGTVGTVSGAECGSLLDPEADLLVRHATHVTGQEYEVTTTEYRWADGQLIPSPEGPPTVASTDDPAEIGRFRCGDLVL